LALCFPLTDFGFLLLPVVDFAIRFHCIDM